MIELTPPPKNPAAMAQPPSSYLTSAAIISPLKRKAQFSQINERTLKALKFDPIPSEDDHDLAAYTQRIQKSLPRDREKYHVLLPFDGELSKARDDHVSYIH